MSVIPLPNIFFCVFYSRWALTVVLLPLWLLLQEPQKWTWGRERHLLQRSLNFLLRDPVRGQLPARNCDLWPREPAGQDSDAGPPRAQRPNALAASGRDAPQDRHAPRENLRRAWTRGCKEESKQGEDDSRARAGEMHPGLPSHQDSRSLPGEEVHVAIGAPAEVPPLSPSGNRDEKDREMVLSYHVTVCKEHWNAYGNTLHTLWHNLYRKRDTEIQSTCSTMQRELLIYKVCTVLCTICACVNQNEATNKGTMQVITSLTTKQPQGNHPSSSPTYHILCVP